jgi:hypothetical protein
MLLGRVVWPALQAIRTTSQQRAVGKLRGGRACGTMESTLALMPHSVADDARMYSYSGRWYHHCSTRLSSLTVVITTVQWCRSPLAYVRLVMVNPGADQQH